MNPKNKTFNDLKYEKWIRSKPCLVCRNPKSECHHVWHTGRKNGRNSYTSIPLCVEHHTFGQWAYHRLEKETFEDKHNLNLEWEIINLLSEYCQSNK